jgi:hypothetical protein
MATKELTKDSITGAIFDDVKARLGEHWMNSEDVIEIRLRQDEDSNSTSIYVLSLHAAYELRTKLDQLLNIQMRNWALNQTRNWPEATD